MTSQPSYPVRWWRCFWGHHWTKWDGIPMTYFHRPDVDLPGGEWRKADGQARDCEVCGLRELRKV